MTTHLYLVGLGNPGEEYRNTPHNAGFQVLDAMRKLWQGSDWKRDNVLGALTSDCKTDDSSSTLIKPETFMNRSGETLRSLAKQVPLAVLAEQLVVLHDDIDLPQGRIKITRSAGAGGHRGVESIMNSLGIDTFVRFKIGVSPIDENGTIRKPSGERAVTDYVLREQPRFSKRLAEEIAPVISEALGVLQRDGLQKAMSLYNVNQENGLEE